MPTNKTKINIQNSLDIWNLVNNTFEQMNKLIQLNHTYRNSLLKECLEGTGVTMKDLILLGELKKLLRRHGGDFEHWILRAEDAIRTSRESREVEEMEELDERVP
ncbi:hypothetical protein BVY01_03415 [bacterium I07]|nr:hypothetical protein BVY01_03415 [bacterium I07]